MLKPVSDLLQIFRDKQAIDTQPYWGCGGEPTCFEVGQAICQGKLTRWTSTGDHSHPVGNREWHIGRIAWLVVHWKQDYPIELFDHGKDLDGGHRLYAAHYLGIKELPTK